MTNLYEYAKNGYTENYIAFYLYDTSIYEIFKSRQAAEHFVSKSDFRVYSDILTFRQAAKLYPQHFSYSKKIIRVKHYYMIKILGVGAVVAETSTKRAAIETAKKYALEHKKSMIIHSVDANTGDVLNCEGIFC